MRKKREGLREDRTCTRCRSVFSELVSSKSYVCGKCAREIWGANAPEHTRRSRRGMRKCRTCLETKPIEAFEILGPIKWHAGICQPCRKADRRLKVPILYHWAVREAQGFCCAICGKHEQERSRVLCLDHCHETGEVRAALCTTCNGGLGMFMDDPELLLKAVEYLRKFKP